MRMKRGGERRGDVEDPVQNTVCKRGRGKEEREEKLALHFHR